LLAELAELTLTAGGQSQATPDNAYFIRKCKATLLSAGVGEWEAVLVVFDCELRPVEQRNLVAKLKRFIQE